jgi:hypothetical protein
VKDFGATLEEQAVQGGPLPKPPNRQVLVIMLKKPKLPTAHSPQAKANRREQTFPHRRLAEAELPASVREPAEFSVLHSGRIVG